MKKDKNRCAGIPALLLLSFGLLLWSVTAIAQMPTLGSYPNANVTAGGNTTVVPGAAPTNAVRATAIANPGFTGVLTVNPATGVVTVTNAKQAGTCIVTVTAFNSGGSTATATFFLTVTSPVCSAGGFAASADLSVSSVATSVATGDFNNDGKQDLAIAEYLNAGTVAIRLGDGSGGFTGTTSVAVGNFPTSVAAGDFNGDGKLDFAASNKNSGTVSIRLGDGLGNFTGSTEVAAGTDPEFVAVGEFNSDGKQDFVVANAVSDNVSIRFGDGAGGFSGTTNMATGDLPRSIAIDDFNGDTKQDLAVVHGNARNVSIYIGNGSGGFTNSSTVSVGTQPYSIAVEDLNGDGKQDLLVANSVSDNVSVLLGDGSGGFTVGTEVAVGDSPQSLAIGDFNGDGKHDFVAVNRIFAGSVAVRLGNGNGGFTNAPNVATSSYPSFLAIGDFNGDGKHDFATANQGLSSVSIRLGVANEINLTGNGTGIADGDNTPAASDHTDFGATTSMSITRTFTIQNTGTAALNIAAGAITISGPHASLFSVSNIALPAVINSPGGSLTFDVTYMPSAAGVHTATVNIVSDDCNKATYDFAIKGEQTCTPPSFTSYPAGFVESNAPNSCNAVVSYLVAVSGSPSPDLTYTFTGTTPGNGNGTGSGASFNKGTTTVTVTATNDCGTATCQFNVTVLDNQPPVLTCPASIVQPASPDQCGRTVGYGHTISDNCGIPFLSYSMSGAVAGSGAGSGSSTYFPAGTTTVVLTATDGANAPVQCTFTVTINDTQTPNINCPVSVSVSSDPGQCGATIHYATPVTSDNCGSAGLDHISGGLSGSFFPTGTTTVQWMATDAANNTKTCTFDITVSDTQPPSISCPAQQTRNADPGVCTALTTYPAPTVSDNCTATPPTVAYSFSGATITPGYLAGTGSGSAFNKGITTVTLRATDQNGLTRTCTFRIIVTDAQPPLITCPPNQSVNTAAASCTSAPVTYATPTATDNCAPAPALTRISGLPSGSAFPAGTNNVVWRATDGSGRTATCSFSVTVTDNTPPVITCPGSVAVLGVGSPCMVNVSYPAPTASDNCGTPTVFLQSGFISGSGFPAGTTVNVFRATDARGTTATCSFSVTVTCSGAANKGAADRGATQDAGTILDFSLSPNPAHQQVLVSLTALPETTGEMQLLVYDVQGRLYQQRVLVEGTQSLLLPVEAWPAGLYWISVQTGEVLRTKRLIVREN